MNLAHFTLSDGASDTHSWDSQTGESGSGLRWEINPNLPLFED